MSDASNDGESASDVIGELLENKRRVEAAQVFVDTQCTIFFDLSDAGFLEIGFFDNEHCHIRLCDEEQNSVMVEEVSIDVARRLRDFLNYAFKNLRP